MITDRVEAASAHAVANDRTVRAVSVTIAEWMGWALYLAVYASAFGGEVRRYRDSNGKEIDAIVTLPDGRWAAVEVKLGGPQMMSAGAMALRDAVAQIDTEVVGEPVLRLVKTGAGPILTLDDGTVTCPLRALAP